MGVGVQYFRLIDCGRSILLFCFVFCKEEVYPSQTKSYFVRLSRSYIFIIHYLILVGGLEGKSPMIDKKGAWDKFAMDS